MQTAAILKNGFQTETRIIWYPGRDLNPHGHYCPKDFKSFVSTNSTTWAFNFRGYHPDSYRDHHLGIQFKRTKKGLKLVSRSNPFYGAGDGIRTRDPNLGKVVLYQLSYSRIGSANIGIR